MSDGVCDTTRRAIAGAPYEKPIFADGPTADFFAEPLENTEDLIVPTVAICEVHKRVLLRRVGGDAIYAVAQMQQGTVRELTTHLALESARMSASLVLPMADRIMLATAVSPGATVWTQDSRLANAGGVRYVPTASE